MSAFFKDFIRFAFLLGLAGLITMLPLSKIVISISEMVMAGAWVLDRFDLQMFIQKMLGDSRVKAALMSIPYALFLIFKAIIDGFREILKNKPALIFLSIFILHLAGLIFTSDFEYAWKDLRTKLPVILLPLFLGTAKQLNKNWFRGYLILFLAAVLLSTFIYSWRIIYMRYIDIRDVSRSVSHIILGLELALSLFILAWFMLRRSFPLWSKFIFLLCSAWFIIYILFSRNFTGLAVFAITSLILLPVLVFRQKRPNLKILLAVLMILLTGSGIIYLRNVVKEFYIVKKVDFSKLDTYTSKGNPYIHDIHSKMTENGNYLYLYVQWDELRDAWNRRSKIPYNGKGISGEKIEYTLVRFLTSKGLRKDAYGVNALNDREIGAIERGVPNYLFMERFSIRSRIYELLWGWEMYKKTGNPTGLTLMQRVEFWKASLGIISGNWLTGVGTGDMNEAFRLQYIKMDSKLAPCQRWRSHNQFLSIFVAFGIFGFLWFLLALFYPPWKLKGYTDYFFLVFIIIGILSMLTEDTLESQTGVTFFTFFYCFFLFGRKEYDRI